MIKFFDMGSLETFCGFIQVFYELFTTSPVLRVAAFFIICILALNFDYSDYQIIETSSQGWNSWYVNCKSVKACNQLESLSNQRSLIFQRFKTMQSWNILLYLNIEYLVLEAGILFQDTSTLWNLLYLPLSHATLRDVILWLY